MRKRFISCGLKAHVVELYPAWPNVPPVPQYHPYPSATTEIHGVAAPSPTQGSKHGLPRQTGLNNAIFSWFTCPTPAFPHSVQWMWSPLSHLPISECLQNTLELGVRRVGPFRQNGDPHLSEERLGQHRRATCPLRSSIGMTIDHRLHHRQGLTNNQTKEGLDVCAHHSNQYPAPPMSIKYRAKIL